MLGRKRSVAPGCSQEILVPWSQKIDNNGVWLVSSG